MREWVQSSGKENMRDRNNDGGLLRARRSATKIGASSALETNPRRKEAPLVS
jgi:hypothetical protein